MNRTDMSWFSFCITVGTV